MIRLVLACAPTTPSSAPAPVHTTEGPALQVSLVDGYGTLLRVQWTQPAAGTVGVEYRLEGGEWSTTPVRAVDAGPVEQLVVGVPYGARVEVRVVSDGVAGDTATLETAPWPDELPVPLVLASNPASWEPTAPYWVTSVSGVGEGSGGRWWVLVLDRAGQVVWAESTPDQWVSRHVSVAADGRALLVDRNTYYAVFDGGLGSVVVRSTLDGTEEHVYPTPGLHHTFVGLPDGRIVWPAKDPEIPDTETLEEVDLGGAQSRIWSCGAFHAAIGVVDTCGSNGLFWRSDTDRFLLSFWSTETVVEIDHGTGESVRWFGALPGSYEFVPLSSQFWWPHGPTWTPAGTLLISTKNENVGQETWVREYVVEEPATLREVWNFGQGRGILATHMGEALRLPSGNTLHGYGTAGHLVETTPDGTVVWEVAWEYGINLGHATPVSNLYALLSAAE